jgi:hypothetical protein
VQASVHLPSVRSEMGVEEKMPPEDQHGGCSHPTTHNCSTDPPTPSGILLTNYMTSSVGIGAWQQVLVSITLPPSSRIPPRSGCLAVAVARLFSGHNKQMTQLIGWKELS